MTNSKSTKSALLTSSISLLLCFAMLLGTTFAWFTDNVSSTNNIITAGNLDIELYYQNDEVTTWTEVDANTNVFKTATLWEPGHTEVVKLKVVNAGTLDLKYQLGVNIASEIGSVNVAGDEFKLSDYIKYAIVEGEQTYSDSASAAAAVDANANKLNVAYDSGEITLESKAEKIVTMVVYMSTTVGNEANYGKGQVIPTIKLGINLVAAQLNSEFDSFGQDYDVDAEYPAREVSVDSIEKLRAVLKDAKDGDIIVLKSGCFDTSENPVTETLTVNKKVTIVPNGMYLVSSAPATFTVAEDGKLVVDEGSFTIKNTSSNGAAVIVDGGEFEMAGGSFDAHTAVRTTAGKSSTVTLSAGWSNRVTVAFDSMGNDTINVTGGSIYSSAESIKTIAGTHTNINISGGLLSSKTTQYSAAVNLQGTATVKMTGGKIENTYSSGYNGSPAIEANVAPTTIELSGDAVLSSKGTAVMLGSHWSAPAVLSERIKFTMSGNSSISATSDMGFGIRYAQDCCDVIIKGNAKVNATYQAIQFNTNNYVYTNSTLTVAENATITSTAGRIGGGYAIASNGKVTVTGGTINGSTAGIASFQAGAVVRVDNSVSGTPITINKVDIASGVDYTVAGNPTIG